MKGFEPSTSWSEQTALHRPCSPARVAARSGACLLLSSMCIASFLALSARNCTKWHAAFRFHPAPSLVPLDRLSVEAVNLATRFKDSTSAGRAASETHDPPLEGLFCGKSLTFFFWVPIVVLRNIGHLHRGVCLTA